MRRIHEAKSQQAAPCLNEIFSPDGMRAIDVCTADAIYTPVMSTRSLTREMLERKILKTFETLAPQMRRKAR